MPQPQKIQSGDIFAVPLADGRFGIAQVVFSHYSRLVDGRAGD
ncbi:immunity 26/phosphotriesterase HocA family protein [Eikenella sp. Marseille-P7795]|nr:immunity 26/phosphotriesterase HocA family protein [Eikenella sp. Marseille-P7795]